MGSRRALVGLGVAAAVLVGCTGDDPDGGASGTSSPQAEESPKETEEPSATDDTDDDDGGGEVSADAGEDTDGATPPPSSAGPVLASVEHPLTEQNGSLDIELRAEEVGELLRVEVTFTPRGIGDERTNLAELLGSYASGNGMAGRLIDPENLLEYETVRDAVRHGQSTPAYQDQPTTLNFYFGAPVEPLETVDFLLDFMVGVPDWPGFVDVPLAAG